YHVIPFLRCVSTNKFVETKRERGIALANELVLRFFDRFSLLVQRNTPAAQFESQAHNFSERMMLKSKGHTLPLSKSLSRISSLRISRTTSYLSKKPSFSRRPRTLLYHNRDNPKSRSQQCTFVGKL